MEIEITDGENENIKGIREDMFVWNSNSSSRSSSNSNNAKQSTLDMRALLKGVSNII